MKKDKQDTSKGTRWASKLSRYDHDDSQAVDPLTFLIPHPILSLDPRERRVANVLRPL